MSKSVLLLLLALALVAGPAFGAAGDGAWSKGCGFTAGDLTGTVGTPAPTSQGLVTTPGTTLTAGPPQEIGSVGEGSLLCYRFNNGAGVHNAGPFQVTAPGAFLLFDPELDAVVTVATAALLVPHLCGSSILTPASPQLSCPSLGGQASAVALDGVEGAPGVNNAYKTLAPGTYYLAITGACLAGNTCQVTIRGVRAPFAP